MEGFSAYNIDIEYVYPCLYYMYAVQELSQLQDKHATRPDVFDDVEEEQEIEILTQEITQVHNYIFHSFTPAIS